MIYFDPWLDDNPACQITLADISDADIVSVSHGHADHLGDAIELVKKTGARLIASPEVCGYAGGFGIGYDTGSCTSIRAAARNLEP